ncbi:MAG: hypothetical protein HZA88_02695 [Verrucomicrobia bacterium]|nr:hypothetical protein [Verrucomicrobiota bacterium]
MKSFRSARKSNRSRLRPLSLVKLLPPPPIRGRKAPRYPFKKEDVLVFIGEIPNMPGHCVIAELRNGKIHAGYHTESFAELSLDEI